MVEVSPTAPVRAMELITILNRCHRLRGFVYQQAHFSADKKSIEVAVRPRRGSAAVCSRCQLPAPGYGQLAERPSIPATAANVVELVSPCTPSPFADVPKTPPPLPF